MHTRSFAQTSGQGRCCGAITERAAAASAAARVVARSYFFATQSMTTITPLFVRRRTKLARARVQGLEAQLESPVECNEHCVTFISNAGHQCGADSPTVATVVDRQFVENQPLNGRSFQMLVELSPGVVVTPANLATPGQFSVNGQRAGSNYFTVDGVSANFGSTASTTLYKTAGGGVPAYSSQGSTASLASVDAAQEFSIQTSTDAPEFGRQPGAQVQLVTRSGANDYHGTLFNYLRNDKLDVNNFFVNANNLARPPIRQNDFGGVIGGPVRLPESVFGPLGYDGRNRTFFFFSYEGVRLRTPFVTVPLQVPSRAARAAATGVLRDILNAFPLPTGAAFANAPDAAPYQAAFSKPSSLHATSLRIDQNFGARLSIFGRVNHAPSVTDERALQFRADAFNLFNQANFANPTGILTSANFGRATQILASGLGGLSPLFQIGGPRSIQLALKLQF